MHIRTEQQLKLHIDQIQTQMDEMTLQLQIKSQRLKIVEKDLLQANE